MHSQSYWKWTVLWIGDRTITIPHDRNTKLPVLHCYKDALATAKTLAVGCVTTEANQNLTSLQKELLKWHLKLDQIGFQWLKWLGRQDVLGATGKKFGRQSVSVPKCAACQYGKQDCNPKPGVKQHKEHKASLKKEKLEPGNMVFTNQYESRLSGRVFNSRGSTVHSQKMVGGTIFIDAASSHVAVYN